jgi:hypothetical protein
MVTDKANWHLYKYKVKAVSLNIEGEDPIELNPNLVQSLYIERDYDNDILPVIMLSVVIKDEYNFKILANQDSTSITLHIQGEIDSDGKGDTSVTHDYIKDTFCVLPIDSTPNVNSDELERVKESSTYGSGGLTMNDASQTRTYILAKRADLKSTKVICNTVFCSANMTTVVSYLLNKSGCTKVLMSPVDNHTMYNELLLLPIPLTNQLRYLTSYYGLHKHGTTIFFDIDRIYVIRKNAGCTAYDDIEPKDVEITVNGGDSGTNIARGSFTNDSRRTGYIDVGVDQFFVSDQSTTGNEFIGDNSLIINNLGDVSEAVSNSKGSFNIMTTSTHNTYTQYETELRYRELKSVISILTANCDLRLLKPNRRFKVNSTSTAANLAVKGDYRLSKLKVSLVKSGNDFTNITEITLKQSDAR